VRNI